MHFHEMETLMFSFKNILKIDNLEGLTNLTKVQLDNNIIEKIENLDHLVNLTWLDLSFNNISKIEGLDSLTKLTDLSLLNNRIEVIENLDTLLDLNVLSIGNNAIGNLENVMYLRKFPKLRLVNLAGNPICKDPEYRPYVLSRIKKLKYLDYRLVDGDAVNTAREQYQDELMEVEERFKSTLLQEASPDRLFIDSGPRNDAKIVEEIKHKVLRKPRKKKSLEWFFIPMETAPS